MNAIKSVFSNPFFNYLIGVVIVVFGIFQKLNLVESANMLLVFGAYFIIRSWRQVFVSMAKNKRLNHRAIWITSMFLMPAVTPLVYLAKK